MAFDGGVPQESERNALREVGDDGRNGRGAENAHENVAGYSVPLLHENAEEEREHGEFGKGHGE